MSGFLPLVAGNVRAEGLAETYRRSPLFASLRDPDHFGGACGACEFRKVCGGSRARAFAACGDPLAEDTDLWQITAVRDLLWILAAAVLVWLLYDVRSILLPIFELNQLVRGG